MWAVGQFPVRVAVCFMRLQAAWSETPPWTVKFCSS